MSAIIDFDRVLGHTQRPSLDQPPAAPFVKWAGGKRGLMPVLAQHLPDRIGTYWEPFVGGGAVFFTIADRIDRAVLSDVNEELVIAYQVVKDHVDDLIDALQVHARRHHQDADYYPQVRAQEPQEAVAIAARFIYLNKTCYNGLYRVNKQGRFNVPEGSQKNPLICNEYGLRTASAVLDKARIRIGDFECVTQPGPGDFVYCDPPYDAGFTAYQAAGFTTDDQARLSRAIDRWIEAGANVVASNADTLQIRSLYRSEQKYAVHEVQAPRRINANAAGRVNAAELIIASHD